MTSFEFKTDPYIFKTIMRLMSNIDYHGYFTVDKNGLSGACINDSENICMKFMSNAELSTLKDKATMILVPQELSKLLRKVARTDQLTLSDTKDEFVMTSLGKKMSVVSKVRKLNRQQRIIKLDDNAYQIGVTVDTKSFFTGLMDIGDCETVNIKQKGNGLVIEMCVDKIRQSVTELGDTDGQTNFSSDYDLSRFLKIKDVQNVSSVLTISFKMGRPLRITAPTNIGHIVFYIKPKIYEHTARTYEVVD